MLDLPGSDVLRGFNRLGKSPMAARLLGRFAGVALLATIALTAQAQTGKAPWERYGDRITESQKVSPLGDNLMGDQVSLSNGALSFAATDVSLPGTGPAISLSRAYSVRDMRHRATDGMFGDWDADIPSISSVHAPNWIDSSGGQLRCSVGGMPRVMLDGAVASDFWQGPQLNIPGVSAGEILTTDVGTQKPGVGGPFRYMTNDQVHISCLSTIKNGAGEGFLAITPDGTRYWFDWMAQHHEPVLKVPATTYNLKGLLNYFPLRRNVLHVSRIEDRFGNVVTYTYGNTWNAPAKLLRINSGGVGGAGGDGRQLVVGWTNNRATSVTDGSRTWTYLYGTTLKGRNTLTRVTAPGMPSWLIDFAAFTDADIMYTEVFMLGEIYRSCTVDEIPPNFAAEPTGTITHPSGAVGQFTTNLARHGRSNVPLTCNNVRIQQGYPNDTNDDSAFFPIQYQAWTLKSKRLTGNSMVPAQWNYAYEPRISYHMYPGTTRLDPVCKLAWNECIKPPCASDACAGFATTTVTGPNNQWVRYRHGNSYRYNEGKLIRVDEGSGTAPAGTASVDDIPSNALQTTRYVYDLDFVDGFYKKRWGLGSRATGDSWSNEYHRPLLKTTTQQQGVDFIWQANTFDSLARPLSITRFSRSSDSPFTARDTRTDVTAYYDDFAKWVIGQLATEINTDATPNIITSRIDYDPATALPVRMYAPSRVGGATLLQQTLGYNGNGTLASVQDGNNNATLLADWYRGVPRLITHPGGLTQSALVNAHGWITRTTDENGFATDYGYDLAGRINLVTFPTGDSTAWNATSTAFEKSTSAEFEMPAGSWRQTVATGNARRVTWFDALWRPRLVREFDTTNPTVTNRFTTHEYDAAGRVSFSAYPLASLSSVNSPTQGVWTTYDALGRPVSLSQDSELNLLTTFNQYVSGFQTVTTNPRGQQTVTQFQAFDQPATGAPTGITQLAGAATEIYRDMFGRTTSLERRSLDGSVQHTRSYVYDAHGRLCKTIEPETGATVLDYDAAGNLAWSAAGLSLPDASQASCDPARSVASTSGRRVVRGYDVRNRLVNLAFPDGRGNQTWAYTPDGLPSEITTNNAANSHQVVNTYTYNRRRLLTAETSAQPGWYTWGIGYVYDANGSLASQSYPTGLSVNYAPNALGQPTQAGSHATGVLYHPNGAIKQFTYGNGLVHTMVQNARQLPAISTDTGGALSQTYHNDANATGGHVADNLDGTRSRWMYYDGLDRLTDAGSPVFGGDHWHRFSYDAIDNLRSWKLAYVKDHANYVYSAENRLAEIRNTTGGLVHQFSYDVQGNLANKNSVGHEFDFGNRLREVAGQEYYRYDGLGRRVLAWKPTGATTLSMYAQNGQILFSSKLPAGGGQTTHENVYLGGSLVATIDHNWPSNAILATKYQHTDALGSPVAMTNEAGAVIERTNYDPYGGAIGKVVDGIGYTGHVMDPATGLTYMQQRYYDPAVGRFLSVDPVTPNPNTGAMFNRYAYAALNPYKFVDPDGRTPRALPIRVDNANKTAEALQDSATEDGGQLTHAEGEFNYRDPVKVLEDSSEVGGLPFGTIGQVFSKVVNTLLDATKDTMDKVEVQSEKAGDVVAEALGTDTPEGAASARSGEVPDHIENKQAPEPPPKPKVKVD